MEREIPKREPPLSFAVCAFCGLGWLSAFYVGFSTVLGGFEEVAYHRLETLTGCVDTEPSYEQVGRLSRMVSSTRTITCDAFEYQFQEGQACEVSWDNHFSIPDDFNASEMCCFCGGGNRTLMQHQEAVTTTTATAVAEAAASVNTSDNQEEDWSWNNTHVSGWNEAYWSGEEWNFNYSMQEDDFSKAINEGQAMPWWLIPVSSGLTAMGMFTILKFDLPFAKKPDDRWDWHTCEWWKAAGTTAPLVGMALNAWRLDISRLIAMCAGKDWISMLCFAIYTWMTSPNFLKSLALWGSLCIQSPVAALKLKPRYTILHGWLPASVATLPAATGFPMHPSGARWLHPGKWLLAVVLLPYAVPIVLISWTPVAVSSLQVLRVVYIVLQPCCAQLCSCTWVWPCLSAVVCFIPACISACIGWVFVRLPHAVWSFIINIPRCICGYCATRQIHYNPVHHHPPANIVCCLTPYCVSFNNNFWCCRFGCAGCRCVCDFHYPMAITNLANLACSKMFGFLVLTVITLGFNTHYKAQFEHWVWVVFALRVTWPAAALGLLQAWAYLCPKLFARMFSIINGLKTHGGDGGGASGAVVAASQSSAATAPLLENMDSDLVEVQDSQPLDGIDTCNISRFFNIMPAPLEVNASQIEAIYAYDKVTYDYDFEHDFNHVDDASSDLDVVKLRIVENTLRFQVALTFLQVTSTICLRVVVNWCHGAPLTWSSWVHGILHTLLGRSFAGYWQHIMQLWTNAMQESHAAQHLLYQFWQAA